MLDVVGSDLEVSSSSSVLSSGLCSDQLSSILPSVSMTSLSFPFSFARVSTGSPGKRPDGVSYGKVVGRAVRKKWHTPEDKEWWYAKFTIARRNKTNKLFEKQGGLCYFCGQQTWMPGQDPLSNNRRATLEHVVCQGRGGTDHMSNVVMSCSGCNNLRGEMKFNKFLKLRQDPEAWRIYCKMKAAKLKERKLKTDEKKVSKREHLAWKIGVLLYLKPEWKSAVEEVQAEIARRDQVRRENWEKKVRNSAVDLVDVS